MFYGALRKEQERQASAFSLLWLEISLQVKGTCHKGSRLQVRRAASGRGRWGRDVAPEGPGD